MIYVVFDPLPLTLWINGCIYIYIWCFITNHSTTSYSFYILRQFTCRNFNSSASLSVLWRCWLGGSARARVCIHVCVRACVHVNWLNWHWRLGDMMLGNITFLIWQHIHSQHTYMHTKHYFMYGSCIGNY